MSDATITALQKSLSMRTLAHSVHSSNIANANVPGYKARSVEFQNRLREAIDIESGSITPQKRKEALLSEAINKVSAQIIEDPEASVNGDGNSVDVEQEMTAIAKNNIGFETAVRLINKKMAMRRYVVAEGNR